MVSCHLFHQVICLCLQEEILDESQNLNDVRPFWPVLKLVEKKGDKISKTLDRRVNNLIGKGQYISENLLLTYKLTV